MNRCKSQMVSKFRFLAIATLGIFSLFSAYANTAELPKPPLSFPFVVQRVGNKIETELQIIEHRGYLFDLQLMFKEGNEEDRQRVRKLAGNAGVDKYGKAIDTGVQIPLRLRISAIDASGERPILDKEVSELMLASWGANSFNKRIAVVILKPGHYRISVESLKNVPELVGTPIIFAIGRNPKIRAIPN